MDKVTIEIDAKWVRIVHSPIYWIVAALQGASVTFAPMFLYFAGQGWLPHQWKWIIIASSYAVIFLVPLFFFQLGSAVISQLRKLP